MRQSKLTRIISHTERPFSNHSCKAILLVSIILVPLVIYYFYWRITENIFFNQAFSYEQRTDLLSSIRDVFIQSIILPLIIIIGLATKAENYRIKKIGIKFLWLYSFSIIIILTLSSQTRPAVTAFILFFASLGFYRKIKLNFRKVIGFSLVTLTIIVLIQSQRSFIKSELTLSSNQLNTAFDLAVPSTLEGTRRPEIYSNILLSRSEGNIRFLADIIDKTNDDTPYLYGRGILIGFSGLIPRVFYPDKPVITSPQIVVKQLLRLPLTDAALTPINQFYVEFGIIGVIIGFYFLGLWLGKYVLYLDKRNSVGGYIFFAFVITHIILMESELFVGLLTTLRNAVIVYFIYLFIKSNLIKHFWLTKN